MSAIKKFWMVVVIILSLVPMILTAGGIGLVIIGATIVSGKAVLAGVASYIGAVVVEAVYEGVLYGVVESVNDKLDI